MTHVGRVRSDNQDSWDRFDAPAGDELLVVVADGMGGHRGGEVASAMAVGTLGSLGWAGDGDGPSRLRAAVDRANAEIHEKAATSRRLDGMGTTVVALLLTGVGTACVAHVGDSRLYRLRNDALESMTADHSLAGQLLANGEITPEEARKHPRRSVLTRALGAKGRIEADVDSFVVEAGDVFLLCSDGVYEMLPDDEIRAMLAGAPDAHTAVAWLIDAANQNGGKDNSTAVVVTVDSVASPTND